MVSTTSKIGECKNKQNVFSMPVVLLYTHDVVGAKLVLY